MSEATQNRLAWLAGLVLFYGLCFAMTFFTDGGLPISKAFVAGLVPAVPVLFVAWKSESKDGALVAGPFAFAVLTVCCAVGTGFDEAFLFCLVGTVLLTALLASVVWEERKESPGGYTPCRW